MNPLILITSIVDIPNLPLSYCETRSVFTRKERFEQTKATIRSLKEKIPGARILLVECSAFIEEERAFFEENCDFVVNVINDDYCRNAIWSISKSWGEGTMTTYAFRYIREHDIEYDRLVKISGRYWLDDAFVHDYNRSDNKSIITYLYDNPDNVCTALYMLSKEHSALWNDFLINSFDAYMNCTGYEEIFASFMKTLPETSYMVVPKIGVSGYIAPFGNIMEM
jgi:hypothetical protein